MLVDVLHSFSMCLSLKEKGIASFFHDLHIQLVSESKFFFLEAPFIGAYFLPINIAWRCHGRGV